MTESMKAKQKFDIDQFYLLTEDILCVLVEDAKTRLHCQFTAHLATDQRGFTIAGIALAILTAILSTYTSNNKSFWIVFSIYDPKQIIAFGMVLAALSAIGSVVPKRTYLPGTPPDHWPISSWPENRKRDIATCRVEHLKLLQECIDGNDAIAKRKAYWQLSSLTIGLASLVGALFTIVRF